MACPLATGATASAASLLIRPLASQAPGVQQSGFSHCRAPPRPRFRRLDRTRRREIGEHATVASFAGDPRRFRGDRPGRNEAVELWKTTVAIALDQRCESVAKYGILRTIKRNAHRRRLPCDATARGR